VFLRDTHPMIDHAAVVAVGVATGAGAVLGAPSPAAAAAAAGTTASATPTFAPTAAPAARPPAPTQLIRPSAACPDRTPEDVIPAGQAPLRLISDRSNVVGQVYLNYSRADRCVQAIVAMYGDLPDCKLFAIVHKDSTSENTSTVEGAYGTSIVVYDWVTDADIAQRAIGFKSCKDTTGAAIIADGLTAP
jgi:hypothetical protein